MQTLDFGDLRGCKKFCGIATERAGQYENSVLLFRLSEGRQLNQKFL